MVGEKLSQGTRLSAADGLICLATHDVPGLGALGAAAKRKRFRERVSYVVNRHLNYTNICVNGCRFCAFQRPEGHPEGYLLSPGDVADEIRACRHIGLREVHLVGAINPEPAFSYYEDLLKAIKSAAPEVSIKAFTAVEIDHIAQKAGLDLAECLLRLKVAGLDVLPGGGAEIFSERVRQKLFPKKIDAARWLAIHGQAHRLGIGSNATMLMGHIETLEERAAHLIKLRDQQDETSGFQAFIPLVFHPKNTSLSAAPGITGVEILKTIATARLILDNVPHIKAYWVMLGLNLAQVALHFGADDLDGTVVHEKITHEAGATTTQGLTREELELLIRDAGFEPVERNTFHEVVHAA
jgi:aminodeoxyfutalosine synthase